MAGNRFGDAGGQALVAALTINPTLKQCVVFDFFTSKMIEKQIHAKIVHNATLKSQDHQKEKESGTKEKESGTIVVTKLSEAPVPQSAATSKGDCIIG